MPRLLESSRTVHWGPTWNSRLNIDFVVDLIINKVCILATVLFRCRPRMAGLADRLLVFLVLLLDLLLVPN